MRRVSHPGRRGGMKLVLLCHRHPGKPIFHELLGEESLTPVDYESNCFVRFVDPADMIVECPRCGSVHEHSQENVPA